MLGIYVWLVLIFIIACCSVPGFLPALATIFGIFALVVLGIWAFAKMTDKSSEPIRENCKIAHKDSERLYREWVEYYKKKNPGWKPRSEREGRHKS